MNSTSYNYNLAAADLRSQQSNLGQFMADPDMSEDYEESLRRIRILGSEGGNDMNIIASIMEHGPEPFIPTDEHVQLLQTALDEDLLEVNPGTLSNSAWYEYLWANDDNGGPLFANHSEQVFRDQLYRARVLAEVMVNGGFTRLRLMDGHGRFTLCFFHALVERGLDPDDYVVNVVDIDSNSNQWHLMFFPESCEATEGDILEELEYEHGLIDQPNDDSDDTETYADTSADEDMGVSDDYAADDCGPDDYEADDYAVDDNGYFTYLNFCSIGAAYDTYGYDRLGELIDACAESETVMISFMVRGMNLHHRNPYAGPTVSNFVIDCILPNWQYVVSRGLFFTGLLTKDRSRRRAEYELEFEPE